MFNTSFTTASDTSETKTDVASRLTLTKELYYP